MADNIRGPVIGEPSRPDGDEERIVTPLSRKRAGFDPKKGIGVAAIFAMAAGMLYFTFEHHTRSDQQAPPSPAGEQINFQAPIDQPAPQPIRLRAEPANPAVVAAHHVQSQTGNEPQTLASKLLAASYEAPLSAFSGGGGGAGAAQAVQPPALSDPTSAGANSETSGLAVQLRSTRMAGVSAGRLPDRDYLITEGTHIPCVLQTALDSTQPGLTACIVPNDILSDNGRVVLLDKGTKIVGEYSGDIHQGEARIFVVWTRAETPTGVVVDLSSPATDALGRSGFDGHVNNHFWQRFGGAILLSVIDDSLSAAGNYAASAAGGTNYANNTQAATESSASTALQNTINIKPTLRKNQGEEVAVTVARDLDFSSVYSLAPTQ